MRMYLVDLSLFLCEILRTGSQGVHAVQEEVFEEVSHLVQSALDGYKVCSHVQCVGYIHIAGA